MKKLVALLLCLMMVVPATLASAETAEGKVLNIWCWNDEFQSRFNAYYPEVKEIAEDKSTTTLNDGTIVKWTINPNEGNNYQNKLDEALRAQESAAADDKIDIFLIEADYALKYVDSPYTLDVKADIGLTDEDLGGQYKYTQEIATSADGKLKAVTWQATPACSRIAAPSPRTCWAPTIPMQCRKRWLTGTSSTLSLSRRLRRATTCSPAMTMRTAPSPTTCPLRGLLTTAKPWSLTRT